MAGIYLQIQKKDGQKKEVRIARSDETGVVKDLRSVPGVRVGVAYHQEGKEAQISVDGGLVRRGDWVKEGETLSYSDGNFPSIAGIEGVRHARAKKKKES